MTEHIIETRICAQCSIWFDITDLDQIFLDKLSPTIGWVKINLPFPTCCPKCRKTRRYTWRNEKNIYKRKCDATWKDIISLFSPDAPCPVYESDYWYSDIWDARQYGRDFDFSRSFFEQWWDLKQVVPMPGKAISQKMENSDYSDNCSNLKNCYLVFNSGWCEDCLYTTDTWHNCKDIIDSMTVKSSEACYEMIDGISCFNTHFSYGVKNCQNSRFLIDCDACIYCYGCIGLKNQKYQIYNTQYSEWEYQEKIKELWGLPVYEQKRKFHEFLEKEKYTGFVPENSGSENTSFSSRVLYSQNIFHSLNINNSQDIRYSGWLHDTRLAMDYDQWWDRVDMIYEWHQIWELASHVYFSVCCWANVSDIFYSAYCVNNLRHCFGCIGLRNATYCIFNKQYTKEEYEILVPRIVEHMKNTWEWWEFIPARYSHFGYNQTMNMIVTPLSKEEATSKWFRWSDYESPFPKADKTIPASKLPDNIAKIPDDILNWAIECEVSKKPFRITAMELEFYRKHDLPIPRRHPDIRYQERSRIFINY